eukprot:TRINITY_DN2611_c0_g1_i6.p2 TRINITY_DN2611_c0_g1~~TRINITY_DN2611_c0_g1_i6.p2  ORF type:complete len:167 (-),score=9.16 TRINITY_DN2611_c0_g1_i6:199-657(-)
MPSSTYKHLSNSSLPNCLLPKQNKMQHSQQDIDDILEKLRDIIDCPHLALRPQQPHKLTTLYPKQHVTVPPFHLSAQQSVQENHLNADILVDNSGRIFCDKPIASGDGVGHGKFGFRLFARASSTVPSSSNAEYIVGCASASDSQESDNAAC